MEKIDRSFILLLQIILMGKVGKHNLGDISIDDISLTPGSCPSKKIMFKLNK